MPKLLYTSDHDFEEHFADLLATKRETAPDVRQVVSEIISDVVARGDAALVDLTAKFDQFDVTAQT